MAETQNSKQNVQAPQAGQTVIVNAIPGQDIVLEAAFDQAEVKLDSGNVIFEFANGGQVVLDFSDIGTAEAPNVVMPDGTVLNMEQFLASLGESDVEPAAGPEGGGEGSGGVGEYRDDAGNLIDGVDKLGVLDPRDFTSITVAGLEANNSLPSAGFVDAAADEDGMRISEMTPFDGNDDERDGDHPAQFSYVEGFLSYDFGGDGPDGTNPFVWSLDGLAAKGVTSEGNILLYEVVDGVTLNAYYMGYPVNDVNDDEEDSLVRALDYQDVPLQKILVFTIEVTDLDTGAYRFELYRPLDHSDPTTEDDIVYNFSYTITDGNGDTAVGGVNMIVDDDSPVITADGDELPSMILDESDLSDDSLSITADFSGYFTTLYGADGPAKGGSGVVESPQMTDNNNFASAISLDGSFTLGSNPDVGNSETTPFVSVNGVGNGQPDYFVFTVKAANTTAVFDIDYGYVDGSDPGNFDSYLHLWNSDGTRLDYYDDHGGDPGSTDGNAWLDSYLTYTFTDPGTYYISVGKFPGSAIENANNPIPVGGTYQLQVSLPGAIMGQGAAMVYELSLEGGDMGSGLYALDATDTATTDGDGYGQGAEIMLSMGEDGRIVGTVGDAEYFSIRVNAATGKVTFEQVENVWHADTDDHDDSAWLNAVAGTIRLTATATDGDGDSESAFLDLSSGVFAIKDDGPSIVGNPMSVSIDEANIDTVYSDGTESGDGPAVISGTLDGLVDFGTDGPGSFGFTSTALQKLYSTDFWWGIAVPVKLTYAINVDAENNTATLVATEPDMLGDFRNSSNVVFEFQLDTLTGEYQFLLYDELRHVESPGEAIMLNFGALIEAVDRDGDSVSLDGAFEIRVIDDVPAPVINLTKASVTHDETPGLQDPNDTTGIAWIFAGIPNRGDDPDVQAFPIGYAKSDSPVVSTEGSKAGADHLLHDKLALKILDPDSGLKTTEGYDITLTVDVWGRVVGRVEGGDMNGKAAFAIALGSDGKLFLVQYLSIQHDNPENPNDIASIDPDKIVVRYTMTDTDGDTRYADADIGAAVQFADDGPTFVGLGNLVVNGSFEEPDVNGWAFFTNGNDVPGWTNAAGNIEIQDSGAGGVAAQDGNQLLELDAHGGSNTNATVTQSIPTANYNNLVLSFWFASRDNGGDIAATNTAEVWWNGVLLGTITDDVAGRWTQYTFKVEGNDDGSDVLLAFKGVGTDDSFGGFIDNVSVYSMPTVDEEGLRSEGNGDLLFASATLSVDFGADGPGAWIGLALENILTSEGLAVTLEGVARADGWFGVDAGGEDVFKVEVDLAAGTYSFTLLKQLDHDLGSDLMKLDFGFTVTDGDGDFVNGMFSVGVFDDAPIAMPDVDNGEYAGNILENDILGADLPAKVIYVNDVGQEDGKIVVHGQFGTLTVDADTGVYSYDTYNLADITLTNAGQDSAGYKNTFGYFIVDDDRDPTGDGHVIWTNTNTAPGLAGITPEYTIEDVDPESVVWFLIPNGGELNSGVAGFENGAAINVIESGGSWVVKLDGGALLQGQAVPALFSDKSFNSDGDDYSYLIDKPDVAGELNWEDILGGGDTDNNDANINMVVEYDLGSDVFDYTVRDYDGDTASSTLTITPGPEEEPLNPTNIGEFV